MHNRANTNTDKAAAARFQRKLVRGRSRRRVAFSTIALFALVFALLSFRLTAGLDPSSSGNTVATTNSTQSTQSATDDNSNSGSSSNSSGPGSGDDDDDDDYDYDDSEDSSESADDDSTYSDESLSADSTTSSPAPTTRAS